MSFQYPFKQILLLMKIIPVCEVPGMGKQQEISMQKHLVEGNYYRVST
jgi:hypothetical protein